MSLRSPISLKALAENKVEGIQKVTNFRVDPRLCEFEDGFNGRPIDRAHIESLKISYRAGNPFPAIVARVDNGRIIVVDGHHRVTACQEMIAEGVEIAGIEATQFRGGDADRVAYMLTSAQGLAMTPLQAARQYRKLTVFGWSTKEIADKVGKTTSYITEMLTLAESNSDVQRMVDNNQVAAGVAAKIVRKHGENAGAVLTEHLATAQASGKTKVTPKTIKPKVVPLVDAIRAEIESEGFTRAEELCPEYERLISYLRGTAKV